MRRFVIYACLVIGVTSHTASASCEFNLNVKVTGFTYFHADTWPYKLGSSAAEDSAWSAELDALYERTARALLEAANLSRRLRGEPTVRMHLRQKPVSIVSQGERTRRETARDASTAVDSCVDRLLSYDAEVPLALYGIEIGQYRSERAAWARVQKLRGAPSGRSAPDSSIGSDWSVETCSDGPTDLLVLEMESQRRWRVFGGTFIERESAERACDQLRKKWGLAPWLVQIPITPAILRALDHGGKP